MECAMSEFKKVLSPAMLAAQSEDRDLVTARAPIARRETTEIVADEQNGICLNMRLAIAKAEDDTVVSLIWSWSVSWPKADGTPFYHICANVNEAREKYNEVLKGGMIAAQTPVPTTVKPAKLRKIA